jgi:oligopeptide transport system substrate-binding protein
MNSQTDDFSLSPLQNEKSGRCFRWKIQPHFANSSNSATLASYVRLFEESLDVLIPRGLCFEDHRDFHMWIQESLPLVKWVLPESSPDLISFYFLCRASRAHKLEALFQELLKNRMTPQKETSILSFHHLYFHFDALPDECLLSLQAKILIEDPAQLTLFKGSLPLFEKEVTQLVKTPHYAKYFLAAKNLSDDFKSSLIYQDLVRLLNKFPHLFNQTIFDELSRFLALSTKEFLESRSSRHLAKLVAAHHVMRKIITRSVALFPGERHLQLRVAQTRLQFLFGAKSAVGLMIGVCLLDRYEFFDEKHILLAVQKFIPTAQAVKGSFYISQSPHDMIRTLYLEIEKRDAEPITLHERGVLKRLLPNELKASVEKLMPAVFMMRNEEEVMKNILILSQELKYFSDFPQVMISLEQQSSEDLLFTIILVRLLRKQTKPLDQLFDQMNEEGVEFHSDRVQIVGYLRKKYPKEANTFRLRIPKESSILRGDSSVNFYLARQKVIKILNEVVGEVRDYNGGMILQQVEQFSELKAAFPETSQRHPDLLEDFFYALTPIEMQATLPLDHLHTLFRLLLDGIQAELPKRDSYVLKVEQKAESIFILLRARDISYRESVQKSLNTLEIFPKALCSTHVDVQGSYCTGFIYDCRDFDLQQQFLHSIQYAVQIWQEMLTKQQVLRLSYLYLPLSLDPRIGEEKNFLQLLFEGLMRMRADGKPACAIAQSYKVSPDLKRYTFSLRESYWANGDPVIAYDFEYAWKKILSPDFSTPFAYLFYPIKNAKDAKEGKVALEEIGVRALDDYTLFVELENPIPYFLELTAFTLYSPINHRVDRIHPNWTVQEGKNYVCNGPFQIKKRSQTHGYRLIKNPLYWNVGEVMLDQVLVSQNNTYTALQMFKNDEIDYLGRPLCPWDPSFGAGSAEEVESSLTPRIFWYVFNVRRFPFTNEKLRKAFAYALNRRALIDELKYEGSPAATPLPLVHTQLQGKGIVDGDCETALALFEEGLKELGIKRSEFPVITLMQTIGEMRNKTAILIARQWQQLFGIYCRLENHEWNTVFEKMTHGDFQIGGMNWESWINDPVYTLNVFRNASEKVNFAKWESEEYKRVLDIIEKEIDSQKRAQLYQEAEKILLHDMPVIPIYYEVQPYKRKKRLQIDVNPATGYIDFSRASILNS